jgi:hypothetical protein
MFRFACIALGAALYRWRGHGKVSGPRWLKLGVNALFLCLPLLPVTGAPFGAWEGWCLALGFAGACWGLPRAHGAYYDLGHNGAGSEADWRWLELRLAALRSTPLREGLLLAVTGLAATLGPGLALVLLGDWSGWLLALSGALKAPAYAVGWRLAKGARATETGEWLTGAAWGAVVGQILSA